MTSAASTFGFPAQNVSDSCPAPVYFCTGGKILRSTTYICNKTGSHLLIKIHRCREKLAMLLGFQMDKASGLFLKHWSYEILLLQRYGLFFQKHTSNHKGNKTLLEELAVPLQCFVQGQFWKLIYYTAQKHNSGQCHCRKALQQLPDVRNPVFPSNGIGENTHLRWDAKPVTKALSLRRLYHPQYRKQAFRCVLLLNK